MVIKKEGDKEYYADEVFPCNNFKRTVLFYQPVNDERISHRRKNGYKKQQDA